MLFLAFSLCIAVGLTCILIKMGTTIQFEFKEINQPGLICNLLVHHYFIGPIIAFTICYLLKTPDYILYPLFVLSLTPATVAASLMTYSVDGDVSMAILLTLFSLLGSIFFTPFIFSLMIKYYPIDKKSHKVKLPYARMFGIMLYVCLCISMGYFNKKRLEKFIKYLQKLGMLCVFSAMILFFAMGSFIEAFNKKNVYKFLGSMILFSYLELIFAFFPVYYLKSKTKDAVIFSNICRNHAIGLAIVTLSFSNTKNHDKMITYTLTYSFVRDMCFLPYLLIMRKIRLGYFLYENKKPDCESIEIII